MSGFLPEGGEEIEELDRLKAPPPQPHQNLLQMEQIPSCRQAYYNRATSLKAAAVRAPPVMVKSKLLAHYQIMA